MWRVRTYKELTFKERAEIAKKRLLNPIDEKSIFAKNQNVDVRAMTKIEDLLNFNEDAAAGALMWRILAKDNDLIELSTDIKQKWAEGLSTKKTILNKDIDTLDKIETTAMKRATLIKAAEDASKEDEPMKISITL